MDKHMKIDIGYSEDKNQKGHFLAHISILIPEKEIQHFHKPGFKSKEDAIEWAKQEVRNLYHRIRGKSVKIVS